MSLLLAVSNGLLRTIVKPGDNGMRGSLRLSCMVALPAGNLQVLSPAANLTNHDSHPGHGVREMPISWPNIGVVNHNPNRRF